MHVKTTIVAMTALALVAGCNRGTANNSAGATANAATPTAPVAPVTPATPPAASGSPVDEAFLVGHWGAAGNCAQTVSFNEDGTATASGEEDPARWTLSGSTLSIIENNDPPEASTVSRSGDLLVIAPARGPALQLTRCPAAGSGNAGTAPPSN